MLLLLQMKQNAIINRHNKQGDAQSDNVSKFTKLLSREVGTMNYNIKTDYDVWENCGRAI